MSSTEQKNLAPVGACEHLNELYLKGHTRNIECLPELPALRMLSLGHIPLEVFAFYTGRLKENAAIRKKFGCTWLSGIGSASVSG